MSYHNWDSVSKRWLALADDYDEQADELSIAVGWSDPTLALYPIISDMIDEKRALARELRELWTEDLYE